MSTEYASLLAQSSNDKCDQKPNSCKRHVVIVSLTTVCALIISALVFWEGPNSGGITALRLQEDNSESLEFDRLVVYYAPDSEGNNAVDLADLTPYATHVVLYHLRLEQFEHGGLAQMGYVSTGSEVESKLKRSVRFLQSHELPVLVTLTGKNWPSLSNLFADWDTFYPALLATITEWNIDGVDIELQDDEVDLGRERYSNVVRLISALRAAMGDDFIITMAPVAGVVLSDNVSRFGYKHLMLESEVKDEIDWLNVKCSKALMTSNVGLLAKDIVMIMKNVQNLQEIGSDINSFGVYNGNEAGPPVCCLYWDVCCWS